MDLFTATPKNPLAEKLRPQSIKDVVGQAHLLGEGRPLRLAFDSGKLHSFVLWGPPGVGKTTIGRLAAKASNSYYSALSAVLAGVKDLRAVVDVAQETLNRTGQSTVLFLDEIHAFNRSQQDILLPHVESGLLVLIGGTTEHPGLQLTSALLSRAQVYHMESLKAPEFNLLYEKARPHLEGVQLDEPAIKLLAGYADGDGRRFLNLLDQVAAGAKVSGLSQVGHDFVRNATSESLRRFDNSGDETYWQLSAFHKALRGSNPDGALYWMARMLDGGGDARHIARRMVVVASEDVGNADPRALQLALNAVEAFDRLGSPEGEFALAQAATYIALAPKSNAAYLAWKRVKEFVRKDGSRPVPLHLRNVAVPAMAAMGYKQGYRYAHDEPNAYAPGQTYLPDEILGNSWYQPTEQGLDQKLGAKLDFLRQQDAEHLTSE